MTDVITITSPVNIQLIISQLDHHIVSSNEIKHLKHIDYGEPPSENDMTFTFDDGTKVSVVGITTLTIMQCIREHVWNTYRIGTGISTLPSSNYSEL